MNTSTRFNHRTIYIGAAIFVGVALAGCHNSDQSIVSNSMDSPAVENAPDVITGRTAGPTDLIEQHKGAAPTFSYGAEVGQGPTISVNGTTLGTPLVFMDSEALAQWPQVDETWVIGRGSKSMDLTRRSKVQVPSSVARADAPIETVPEQVEPQWPLDDVGSGMMGCIPPGGTSDQFVPVPLEHTAVNATIDGFISQVGVTQRFHNPYSGKIEAVYVFPLPQDSAVSDFIMTVGDRTIRGIIRQREEAQRIYEQARAQGHVASLLQQERPNIFTQKVANIESGKSIDIDITYFGTLPYRNGGFEFVFPMVVGPRYNPSGTTDPIAALPRGGAAGSSNSGTAVTYLPPNERSGHDIDITLTLDAGVSIESMDSTTHAVSVDQTSATTAVVTLSPLDTIPNRDFVFTWHVAGKDLKTAVLTHRDQRGGFFSCMIVPPAELTSIDRAPMEMVFVLDTSGSMRGQPMNIARQAVKRALRKMRSGDTFQIIRFAQGATQMAAQPIAATPDNVERGIRYLDGLEAGGGTNMIHGIRSALGFHHDDTHVRSVVFLTDGYIGNESDILGEIGRNLGDARIFSFGIGSSPNSYLLQRMADIGHGQASYIGLDASRVGAMDEFFEMTSHPAMHDVVIDLGDDVTDVFPSNVPDVFVDRPIFITGRLGDGFDGDIKITGRVGGEEIELDVEWGGDADRPALAQIWARSLIRELNDPLTWSQEDGLDDRILKTALAYNLASAYTSFVAVDSSIVTEGDYGTTVHVPVPMPAGVRYDTTVDGGG